MGSTTIGLGASVLEFLLMNTGESDQIRNCTIRQ